MNAIGQLKVKKSPTMAQGFWNSTMYSLKK